MSDEMLDELFREAFDNLNIEFEPSSWEKLKGRIDKTEISDAIEQVQLLEKNTNPFYLLGKADFSGGKEVDY
jgi:hypothetical protein